MNPITRQLSLDAFLHGIGGRTLRGLVPTPRLGRRADRSTTSTVHFDTCPAQIAEAAAVELQQPVNPPDRVCLRHSLDPGPVGHLPGIRRARRPMDMFGEADNVLDNNPSRLHAMANMVERDRPMLQ